MRRHCGCRIMILKLQPLTVEAFEPFGQVLSWEPGDHPRRNFAANLFNDRALARPNLRVQRTHNSVLPHTATVIERHRHSSQVFAPLSGGPFLVIVFLSDADGKPVPEKGIAFRARGDQAVNYNRDTWHHGFMAYERPGSFLMLRWDDGTPDDEEFLTLDQPIVIEA
jgi:ureidoglycolate lyase